MKYSLLPALLFLTLTAQTQMPWPRNPKTGKVEFRGSLPWPAAAKTDAQRRVLVRRWYLAKVTDVRTAGVAAIEATETADMLTYAGLPKMTDRSQEVGNKKFLLSYLIDLMPTTYGLNYQITHFRLAQASDLKREEATPLEPKLAAPTQSEQAAFALFRKRLAVAVAGW